MWHHTFSNLPDTLYLLIGAKKAPLDAPAQHCLHNSINYGQAIYPCVPHLIWECCWVLINFLTTWGKSSLFTQHWVQTTQYFPLFRWSLYQIRWSYKNKMAACMDAEATPGAIRVANVCSIASTVPEKCYLMPPCMFMVGNDKVLDLEFNTVKNTSWLRDITGYILLPIQP